TLIRELAERLQIPVITTPKGKGIFPESHPLSLGVFGMGGHPSSRNFLAKGVDVTLAMGTRMGELSSQGWSSLLKPVRTLIHVDIEATQVGRSYATHICLTAPVEHFLAELLKRPELQRTTPAKRYGVEFYREASTSVATTPNRITSERAVVEIARRVGPRARFTADSGEHMLYAIHYTPAEAHDTFLLQLGLGAMGGSIAAGIGLQVADPERPVVVLCGDGGFLMCAGEVATAAQAKLPVIFAVFNDHRLGMTELGHHAFYNRSPAFPTGPADLAALARSLGAEGYRIESPEQFDLVNLSRRRDCPVVLDIQVDPAAVFSKDVDSKRSWMTTEGQGAAATPTGGSALHG
ncbi:MAG: thiamine pyrophosphate-binding protein, partial [Archangium sp.]|nr:thiamine pyrophosphate-binding protein [Archangium sp.]